MTVIDHRKLNLPRRPSTPEDILFDKKLTLLLSLLVASPRRTREAFEHYLDLLENRAVCGAKQGDC